MAQSAPVYANGNAIYRLSGDATLLREFIDAIDGDAAGFLAGLEREPLADRDYVFAYRELEGYECRNELCQRQKEVILDGGMTKLSEVMSSKPGGGTDGVACAYNGHCYFCNASGPISDIFLKSACTLGTFTGLNVGQSSSGGCRFCKL